MPVFRFLGIASVLCLGVAFFIISNSSGQELPASAEGSSASSYLIEPYRVRVDVVAQAYPFFKFDVVVLDGKGRQITDLTAADFDVYQDGVRQEAASAVYISHQSGDAKTAVSQMNLSQFSAANNSDIKDEDVRRNIVFFVGCLGPGITTEARKSLKGFVDKRMQTGDNVAIVQAAYGGSVMDMFLTDKRELTARVDGLTGECRSTSPLNNWITFSHALRTLKGMPGRKILFLISTGFGDNPDWLVEEALRSGVVVHFMRPSSGMSSAPNRDYLKQQAARTGGNYFTDKTFFKDGIGNDANTMISGKYIISWDPPYEAISGDNETFHRVTVNVKRKDAEVYAPEGFYAGMNESEMPSYPLRDVIFSPFQHTGLNVNMTAGWMKSPAVGNIIRSWVHLDAKDVKMTETERGARIELETAYVTTDRGGRSYDIDEKRYVFDIGREDIEWVRKNGIRFTRVFQVKNPGLYTFHMAVRDALSGSAGAVYQVVDIPDFDNNERTLSDIFLLTNDADINWLISSPADEINSETIYLTLQKDETPSPAFRTYEPGDVFHALMIAYNANVKLEDELTYIPPSGSNWLWQPILTKKPETYITDMERLYVGYEQTRAGQNFAASVKPLLISDSGAGDFEEGILVSQRFAVIRSMPPGDYRLRMYIQNTDKTEIMGVYKSEGTVGSSVTTSSRISKIRNIDPPTDRLLSLIIIEKR